MRTPLIKINYLYQDIKYETYIKLEYFNLTGSIKDRVAKYMLKDVNKEVVEATSGNTGIALAAYSKYKVTIFMPDFVSIERVNIMKSFGATVNLISKEEGGFKKCLELAKNYAIKNNAFYTDQFSNKQNYLAHYNETAVEILDQFKKPINSFVSGVGTGGTLMGIGDRLKKEYNTKTIAIEPDMMPLIKEGKIYGPHKIEGIGDDFIPDLIKKENIDEIFLIDDNDAINMARLLAKELGLGVGISSGANFLGTVLANKLFNGNTFTVFPDDNKKYLSTPLNNEVDLNELFLSNNIKLINYDIIE